MFAPNTTYYTSTRHFVSIDLMMVLGMVLRSLSVILVYSDAPTELHVHTKNYLLMLQISRSF